MTAEFNPGPKCTQGCTNFCKESQSIVEATNHDGLVSNELIRLMTEAAVYNCGNGQVLTAMQAAGIFVHRERNKGR